jgi:hypothetical protein
MSFATPREGAASPRGSPLPPASLSLPPPPSLLEQARAAGRTTPRGAASPRVSPLTPRPHEYYPPPPPESRGALLLEAAEAGAAAPPLPPLPLRGGEPWQRPPVPLLRVPPPGATPATPRQACSASAPLLGGGGSGVAGASAGVSSAASSFSSSAYSKESQQALRTWTPSDDDPLSLLPPAPRSWARRALAAVLPADVTSAQLRVPTQMCVAVLAAALLFVFRTPHGFMHGKGLWTAITVILVLEPTFGATNRKVKLRMVGTVVGGGLGGAVVAAANVINGGWTPPPGNADAVPKSLAVAGLVAACSWVLEFRRLRDPNRECALCPLRVRVCCLACLRAAPCGLTCDMWRTPCALPQMRTQ